MQIFLIYARIGEVFVRAWFGIIDSFAVELLSGTLFLGRSIREIFPGKHELFPWHSTPVDIIKTYITLVSSLEESNEWGDPNSNMSAALAVSEEVLTALFLRQAMQASTSTRRLLNSTPVWAEGKASKTKVVSAHGVTDAVQQRPFPILISDFTNLSKRLHKGEKSAVSSVSLECVNHPISGDLRGSTDAISNVNTISVCKKPESEESQTGRHGQFKDDEEDAFKHHYKVDVEIAEEYKQYSQSFTQMLE